MHKTERLFKDTIIALGANKKYKCKCGGDTPPEDYGDIEVIRPLATTTTYVSNTLNIQDLSISVEAIQTKGKPLSYSWYLSDSPTITDFIIDDQVSPEFTHFDNLSGIDISNIVKDYAKLNCLISDGVNTVVVSTRFIKTYREPLEIVTHLPEETYLGDTGQTTLSIEVSDEQVDSVTYSWRYYINNTQFIIEGATESSLTIDNSFYWNLVQQNGEGNVRILVYVKNIYNDARSSTTTILKSN